MNIVYFGYNDLRQHKRGVENVIDFQSKAIDFERVYYIHWGTDTILYRSKQFICVSIKKCWYWPLILNMILFRIKRKHRFIIHSHNPLFSFVSYLNSDILSVHDALYYLDKSKHTKDNPSFYMIEKLVYYRCSQVHFISNYAKEQSLFGKRENFTIIPNTSHFEPLVPFLVLPQVSTSYTKNILIVRSIEERARFDLLLQVAKRLEVYDYKFIVAGKGPLLEHYHKEIQTKKLRNIEMLGYVDNEQLLHLYSKCDIVLMIAEYGEGFGLPIIEGYLFNKPVIASNRCAIPEVIISDDYLFENTADDIIQSINFVFSTQNNNNFRAYYNKQFSNSIVLAQFNKLYSNFYQ
jgi:glycosyltransferase involved in cell wall biosynthesis